MFKKDNHWMSVSDLMAGLMLFFLLISLIYMSEIEKNNKELIEKSKVIDDMIAQMDEKNRTLEEKNTALNDILKQMEVTTEKMESANRLLKEKNDFVENITNKYKDTKKSLYNDLNEEFREDFIKWNAAIDPDSLSIKFMPNPRDLEKSPDVFFEAGSSELTMEYQKLLDNFFPRYLKILASSKYRDEIEEIRIEGHTSSEWSKNTSPMESYFKNMELSQARTRNVLEYLMKNNYSRDYNKWLITNVTANGLSYSQPLLKNGIEDFNGSRRVEFRVRMKMEKYISTILSSQIEKIN